MNKGKKLTSFVGDLKIQRLDVWPENVTSITFVATFDTLYPGHASSFFGSTTVASTDPSTQASATKLRKRSIK